jgi:hypothetical protein
MGNKNSNHITLKHVTDYLDKCGTPVMTRTRSLETISDMPYKMVVHLSGQKDDIIRNLNIADGGFKKYSDIIKSLCLGSDYVMLGSILSKSF